MQRIIAARGELRVDVEQIADAGDLGRQDDHVVAEAVALGGSGGLERAGDHGLNHHVARGQRLRQLAVLVHHARQQTLIKRSPVDADADRLVILDGALDHDAEVRIVFAPDRNVAGIDAVLGEGARSGRIFLEQDVAVVMKVADDRHAQAALFESFNNVRNGCRGVFIVDRDANQLGAGESERRNLGNCGLYVGRIGVGHRLDDDGNFPADSDVADADGWSFSAGESPP